MLSTSLSGCKSLVTQCHNLSFSSYVSFFKREEEELGMIILLQKYLPVLLSGWVGAFTHATIHTGWGISVRNKCMIIEGLAYMAYTYVNCNATNMQFDKKTTATSPIDSILGIARYWKENTKELQNWVKDSQDETISDTAKYMHRELKRSGLQYRIACMVGKGHPLIYETPGWLIEKGSSTLWEELYYMVTILYLSAPSDFVILHLITSLHAMENIAEVLPEEHQKDVIKQFWIGILGILFSKGNFPKEKKIESLHNLYKEEFDQVSYDCFSRP